MRTEKDVLIFSREACEIRIPVCGVKGPTVLSKICPKFITSTAIDAMHLVFEGVAKTLMEFWFDVKFANENFSIPDKIEQVD